MIIGSHVSFGNKQLISSVQEAISYNANTFMFYTGAPQNTFRKSINPEYTNEAKKMMNDANIDINNVICHAPYIINLANKENLDSWNFSINFTINEIKRMNEMNIKYLVIHPGNYLKQDINDALKNISDAINKINEHNKEVMILLETMAGKGTECGRNIDELKQILNNIKDKNKVGICIDTCHLNDSGININDINEYLDLFDKIIGIEKIKCVHLNDSKNIIGSKKDRHENIGFGTIGFDALLSVVNHPKLKEIPKILETPYIENNPPYKFEIEMLKKGKFNPNLKEDVTNYYKNDPNF